MNNTSLLDGLNPKQRQAVEAPAQNMLVLAGAGSGKTRVLVQRIAYLLQERGVSPYELMAVTFTNKAAAEMRHRIADIVGFRYQGIWLGTFHGLAHRLLRAHYRDAKLPEDFQILDSDDQYRLVKRIIRGMNLDEKKWPAKQAMWFINGQKDEGLRPEHIDYSANPIERQLVEVYRTYQDACERAGLVDFAELLLRALELLRNNAHILSHYQQRFKHILVDEFQDTNAIQYAWLRLLAGHEAKVMIVGDDDQSIYGWRGAKVENIQHFSDDFSGVDVIRLEQNYRSSGTILRAANELIAHNEGRLGKNLWTEGAEGEPILVYAAFNEVDEARFVVSQIRSHLNQGGALLDCAILYRNNAQSRVLEEALMQEQLAYRIYGGVRFFERQEIKDALAYLRLMNNRQDDASFERVVNTPTRGIGQRTLELVRQIARERRMSMWNAASTAVSEKLLNSRAANAITGFSNMINQLALKTSEMELSEQTDYVITHSGLLAMYQNEKGEKAEARVDNLQELITATRQFVPDPNSEELSDLVAFLSHAALEAGDNQAEEDESAVQLMTLHSAKGLEFPVVFLVGVEEGMFPSQQSAEDADRLEEERRLAYVGMTRAMSKLYMCHAESRRLYGKESFHSRSRFIRELPQDCLSEVRMTTQVTSPMGRGRFSDTATKAAFESTGFQLGQRVRHPKFGEGVILQYEGSGAQSQVQIQFDDVGCKRLVVAFAKLTPIN